MKRRKILAIITALTMIFGTFSMSFAAEETDASVVSTPVFTDVTDHWGKEAIEKWAGFGIINGYEGIFRPDDSITRGELAVILDNMMDYQAAADNTFTDLQAGQFYTDAVLKANAAGIFQGYDGYVRPTEKITKEETAVIFSRAFGVETASQTKAFLDASAVSDWAQGAVFGLEAKGYISGFGGYFNPKASITRAETVTIINNIVKAYYTAAGVYTGDVDGTAVIKVSDVTLQDVAISGNLIIAEGVADGDVTLDGVTVEGDTIVRGGGENSIVITGDSNIQSVKVEKVGGKIRILADGVVIGEVEANEEVILEGTFTNVTVAADAAVTIQGNVTKLDLAEGSAVDIKSGTVTTMNIPAGATANISSGATVKTANVTGAAEIKGTGKIETAVISGKGATIAQTPAKIEVKEGGEASVGGKTVTDTTNPATSTGGGGGGDNDGGSVTHPTLSLTNLNGGGISKDANDVYQVPVGLIQNTSASSITVNISGDDFVASHVYEITVTVERTSPRQASENATVTDVPGSLLNQNYSRTFTGGLPELLTYFEALGTIGGNEVSDELRQFLQTQQSGSAFTVTYTYKDTDTNQTGTLNGGIFEFELTD